jgi:hypothetical protein
MAGRGPQSFKKRQKEQQRKERQQEKLAKKLQRKLDPRPSEQDEPIELLTEPVIYADFGELELDVGDQQER